MQKNISIVQMLIFAKAVLMNGTWFYLPLLLAVLGFAGWQTGFLLAASSFCGLIFSFGFGAVNDVFSPKKSMSGGIMLLALFNLGMYFASGFWEILLLMLIGGTGVTLIVAASSAYILKSKVKKEGEKYGKTSFANGIGGACGYFLVGAVLHFAGFGTLFILNALFWCVALLYSLSLSEVQVSRQSVKDYWADFANKRMALVFAALFLFGMHWGAEATSYALFLKNNLGLDALWSGIYIGGAVAALALTAMWIGKKAGEKDFSIGKWLFIGLLLSGVFHIAMIYPDAYASFGARVFHEIGDAIVDVMIWLGIAKIMPIKRMAGGYGAVVSAALLGNFCGLILYGHLGSALGYWFPLVASGAITLISLLIVYYNRKIIFGK